MVQRADALVSYLQFFFHVSNHKSHFAITSERGSSLDTTGAITERNEAFDIDFHSTAAITSRLNETK